MVVLLRQNTDVYVGDLPIYDSFSQEDFEEVFLRRLASKSEIQEFLFASLLFLTSH